MTPLVSTSSRLVIILILAFARFFRPILNWLSTLKLQWKDFPKVLKVEELSGQEPRDRKWGHLRIKQHFGLRPLQ